MTIKHNRALLTILTLFLIPRHASADPLTLAQINNLKKSIIKVHTSTGRIGTGFVYSSSNYAVTAFHVVAGSDGTVQIEYTAFGSQYYSGRVIKTLKNQDLALIEITNPRSVTPLRISDENPVFDKVFTCLGFLWDALDVASKEITKKETKPLRYWLPSDALKDIQNAGCPSTTVDMLQLDGNPLVPGYSGAPIFSKDEGVIGIADGGVREGLGAVSWGIPATALNSLFHSTEDAQGNLVRDQTHFSADVISNPNWKSNYFMLSGLKYSKISNGVLGNLANGTDDPQGLNLILSTFPPQMEKVNIRYDVYQNFESGSVLILPGGLQVHQNGDGVYVTSRDGGSTLTIKAVKINDINEIWPKSTLMENTSLLQNQTAGYSWTPDVPFTYILTTSRIDGFMARRKAFKEYQSGYNQFGQLATQLNNYLFESFIYKRGLLLQLVTTNRNYNNQYFLKRLPCDQTGFTAQGCKETLAELSGWGNLIIATQYATFSYN